MYHGRLQEEEEEKRAAVSHEITTKRLKTEEIEQDRQEMLNKVLVYVYAISDIQLNMSSSIYSCGRQQSLAQN